MMYKEIYIYNAYTRRQVKRPSKRRTAKPPTTPPTTGPAAILLFEEVTVDTARTVVTGDGVDNDVNEERNIEPSEVTSELVMITVGDGVVTTDVNDDDVDVSVEVSESENEVDDGVGVDVNVGVEGVVVDDEIEREDREDELEEHEDPKRVDNTVTGTLTVNVVGTITVVVLPE